MPGRYPKIRIGLVYLPARLLLCVRQIVKNDRKGETDVVA